MPKRIAVIDIGSNTVRLVVYDGNSRSPLTFYNEKVTCRLGLGLKESGVLNPDGAVRAMRALRRFRALVDAMEVGQVVAIATAAVRSAKDGADFVARAKMETGFEIRIISGEEEARLAALGVISGIPQASGVVCDMGGSSMELSRVADGQVFETFTTPFAPLSIASGNVGDITSSLVDLRSNFPEQIKTLYLVGGSFRAIARLDLARRDYPLSIIHDYRMTAEGVDAIADLLDEEETRIAASDLSISSDRFELLPSAVDVLRKVISVFQPSEICLSSFGLREGGLYDALPKDMRDRDPLISAAEAAAKRSARFPDFGQALFEWLVPLFEPMEPKRRRLIQAACLLHDVNWRAHPDYRAELSFDTAARANLAGLSHEGRVLLGLALMHRYKLRLSSPAYLTMSGLLSDEQNQMAEAIGKAMRLGALFSSAGAEGLGGVDIRRDGELLVLDLDERAGDFDGEQVERRLTDVARALGLTADICINGRCGKLKAS